MPTHLIYSNEALPNTKQLQSVHSLLTVHNCCQSFQTSSKSFRFSRAFNRQLYTELNTAFSVISVQLSLIRMHVYACIMYKALTNFRNHVDIGREDSIAKQ